MLVRNRSSLYRRSPILPTYCYRQCEITQRREFPWSDVISNIGTCWATMDELQNGSSLQSHAKRTVNLMVCSSHYINATYPRHRKQAARFLTCMSMEREWHACHSHSPPVLSTSCHAPILFHAVSPPLPCTASDLAMILSIALNYVFEFMVHIYSKWSIFLRRLFLAILFPILFWTQLSITSCVRIICLITLTYEHAVCKFLYKMAELCSIRYHNSFMRFMVHF